MKKTLIAIISAALLASTATIAMTCHAPNEPHDHYAVSGYYYLDGTIITADGNVWDFQTDAFTAPETWVKVIFCDNGTPYKIEDDSILHVTELPAIGEN